MLSLLQLLHGIVALNTVLVGVSGYSLRPVNFDETPLVHSSSQRRVFQLRTRQGEQLRPRYRELNAGDMRDYVRTRRRIQSLPQIFTRNQDHLDIESPIFNAPLPVITRQNRQTIQRRQDAPNTIKTTDQLRQKTLFRDDGIVHVPMRRLFKKQEDVQRYIPQIKTGEPRLLRNLKPVSHRRERQRTQNRRQRGPFANTQEDVRPEIIYKIRDETQLAVQIDKIRRNKHVSPIKLSYERSTDGNFNHPNHRYREDIASERRQPPSSEQIEIYTISEHRRPSQKKQRVQLSEPEIREFQQKQQQELQYYRQQKQQNQRRKQQQQQQQSSFEKRPSRYEILEPSEPSYLVPFKSRDRRRQEQKIKPVELRPVYASSETQRHRERQHDLPFSWDDYDNTELSVLPEYRETLLDKQSIREHPNAFKSSLGKEEVDVLKEKRHAHHSGEGGYSDHNGKEFAAAASAAEASHGHAGDGRLTFQLHGQNGPHSYRFGFDTGKGPNRQFRYEERDNNGLVKGRYGYYDSYGKLRMYNYSAHPEHGYSAVLAQ